MTLSTAFFIVCVAAIAYLIGFYHGGKFVLKTMRERFNLGASPAPGKFVLKTMRERFNLGASPTPDQGEQPGTGSNRRERQS